MNFVRNTLSQSGMCVCVTGSSHSPHPRSRDKGTGTDMMYLLSIPWRAAPLLSSGRRGHRHPRGSWSTPAAPCPAFSTLVPCEWGRMQPCHPQPGGSSGGTPAPRPDYCWVSKKTLKSKEESCEEGHFSGSFSLSFFFPPRRKLEKQSPQSRIERVTETG